MTNGRVPKTTVFLFIVIFILLSGKVFSANVSIFAARLEDLVKEKQSYTVKTHLKNSAVFSERGMSKSLEEEILILNEIDKTSSDLYIIILNTIDPVKYKAGSVPVIDSTQAMQKQGSISEKLSRAELCYTQSRLSEAKVLAQDVLSLDPGHKRAAELSAMIDAETFVKNDDKPFQDLVRQLYEEGVKALRASNYKQAQEKLSKALEMDIDNKQLKKYLAIASEKMIFMKEVESKEKMLETADKLRASGKTRDARKLYEKVLVTEQEDKTANFYINDFNIRSGQFLAKAKTLRVAGDLENADRAIKTALDFDPDNSDAFETEKLIGFDMAQSRNTNLKQKEINRIYNKGVTAYGKAEYSEALRCWEEVLRLNPEDKQSADNIEKTKLKMADEKEATALRIQKGLEAADAYFNQGFMDKANTKYQYVLRLDSQNEKALAGLARVKEATQKDGDEKVSKR